MVVVVDVVVEDVIVVVAGDVLWVARVEDVTLVVVEVGEQAVMSEAFRMSLDKPPRG